MPKKPMKVVIQYAAQGSSRELIEQVFIRYLRRMLKWQKK